jgi:hypothetical protein
VPMLCAAKKDVAALEKLKQFYISLASIQELSAKDAAAIADSMGRAARAPGSTDALACASYQKYIELTLAGQKIIYAEIIGSIEDIQMLLTKRLLAFIQLWLYVSETLL